MTSYQFLPPLSDAEYEALRADIAANGMRHPILVDEKGKILDGHHRARIAAELGFKPEREVLAGLTEEEKRDVAFTLNAARRHMDTAAKRAAVVASLKADPQLSDRQHARRCGSSHPTVAGIRAELIARGQVESFTTSTGADGKTYTRPTSSPAGSADAHKAGSEAGQSGHQPPVAAGEEPTPGLSTAEAEAAVDEAPTVGAVGAGETAAGVQSDAPADGANDGDAPFPAASAGASDVSAAPARPGPVEGTPGSGRVTPDPLDDPEAIEEQRRERSSAAVAEALVAIRMRLEPDPIRWLRETWKPGGYRLRDMPRVRDSFTPEGLRQSAKYLETLADHLEQNGETL